MMGQIKGADMAVVVRGVVFTPCDPSPGTDQLEEKNKLGQPVLTSVTFATFCL